MLTTKQTYRLRRMTPPDIQAVVTLDRRVFSDPWPESSYVQELYYNLQAHYFVLHKAGPWRIQPRLKVEALLGFVGGRVEPHNNEGHISTLAVVPELRGQGLGEYLLLAELHALLDAGAQSLMLEVRVSNRVAQALYSKYGFEVYTTMHRYYADGEDAYLMRLDPPPLVLFQQLLTDRCKALARDFRF